MRRSATSIICRLAVDARNGDPLLSRSRTFDLAVGAMVFASLVMVVLIGIGIVFVWIAGRGPNP